MDLKNYNYSRLEIYQEPEKNDFKRSQQQILKDCFPNFNAGQPILLRDCRDGGDQLMKAFKCDKNKAIVLFIDNALRSSDLNNLLPQDLGGLPQGSRILVTTRNLAVTDMFEGQPNLMHRLSALQPLPREDALKILFNNPTKTGTIKDEYLNRILKICSGVLLALNYSGIFLHRESYRVDRCIGLLKVLEDGDEIREDELSDHLFDFVYVELEEYTKEALLDICFFFDKWNRQDVEYIVGGMTVKSLLEAGLITSTTKDNDPNPLLEELIIHEIMRAKGQRLAKGNIITDVQSLRDAANDQRLDQIKGVWLVNEKSQYVIEERHLNLMRKSLRVLALGEGMKVSTISKMRFEKLMFLHMSGDIPLLPVKLEKLDELMVFHGPFFTEGEVSLCKLPKSLLSMKVIGQFRSTECTNSQMTGAPLCSLEKLDFSELMELHKIPKGFNQLVALEDGNEKMWELPEQICQLPSLKALSMRKCKGLKCLFTYSVKPTVTVPTRFVMSESGDIKVYSQLDNTNVWTMFWAQPRDQCQVYALCGAYGTCTTNNVQFCSCLTGFTPQDQRSWADQAWSGGCKRQTNLDCGNMSTDGFMELTGKSMPAAAVAVTGSASAQDCRSSCLSDCNCTAYTYDDALCNHWVDDLLNLFDSSSASASLFVRLAAKDVPPVASKSKSVGAGVVGGAVGGVAAVLGVLFVVFFFIRRRRSQLQSADYTGPLTVYSYRELQSATKNFSERLGGGGFGSVFKGSLGDKTLVAVKKLEGISQGEKQFRMEVSTIGTIQHVNLIRLRGFCSEGSSRMLVYDYLPNGSLDKVLFSKNESVPILDWKTRFNIALGMARGILYLHEKCRDCIIHCDIKPENILLDSEFCPKVADFGLSKLMGREFSHVLTTMRGTRGYLAPEWISGLPITPKADVYSFGMTLLEIIAGRRNMEESSEHSEWFFPTWAATQINQENTMDLLDRKLNNNADAEQLKRAAMVGGWCIQDDEDLRPSMSQVVQILEGIGNVSVPPVPRSLQALVAKPDSLVFYWDKETAPKSNTSSSTSSNAVNNSAKGSENFSNSLTSHESFENGDNHKT